MENILTARQFTDLCKSYGFKKLKANYFRCVGDGILQVISTQNREYMSPNSPYYSSTNRKSNTVSLGFISMYSVIPEYFFCEYGCARFCPANLYGRNCAGCEFMGIQEHYSAMLDKGFDLLNSMKTQKDLLDNAEILSKADSGHILYYQTEYCAPFLICGKPDEAFQLIAGRYTQNTTTFHLNFDSLISAGNYDEYFQRMNELQSELAPFADLFYAILTKNNKKIEGFLRKNYQQNMQYAEKYQIPFSDDYAPLF